MIKTHKIEFPPPQNLEKYVSGAAQNLRFLGIIMLIMGCTFLNFIFMQFMQFPVVDFGLANSGSQPFILVS